MDMDGVKLIIIPQKVVEYYSHLIIKHKLQTNESM